MPWMTLLSLFVILFAIPIINAQDEQCPVFVQEALSIAQRNCETLGRNEACYGNAQIQAIGVDRWVDLAFEKAGDRISVLDIQTLQANAMRLPDEWGIAMLSVQANLPETIPGQNIFMLLLGDVTLQNTDVASFSTIEANVNGIITVYAEPDTNSTIVTALAAESVVTIDGQNTSGDWVHVQTSKDRSGWVQAVLLGLDDGSLSHAESVGEALPMQAFTFRSGIGTPQCAEAPPDGILIQTPHDTATIDLSINGVQITLGSTAFLQAQPNGDFLLSLLEGQMSAAVESLGTVKEVVVQPGMQIRIPLNVDGMANGEPIVRPFVFDMIRALPFDLLPREITLPALTLEDFDDIPLIRSGNYQITFDTSTTDCWWYPDEIRDTYYRDTNAGFTVADGLLEWRINAYNVLDLGVGVGQNWYPTITDEGTFEFTKITNRMGDEVIGFRHITYTLEIISETEIRGTLAGLWLDFDRGSCSANNAFTAIYSYPFADDSD